MTMRSWIRKLFTRPVPRTIRKAPRQVRLDLEALEERCVPSTFSVNTLGDGSGDTLRWAVGQANAAGGSNTIAFDATVFATAQTITLGGTQLELTDTTGTTTITGPAAGVTISGGGLSRVFQIDAGVTASLAGITITGGNASSGGGLNNKGALTLINSSVSGNSAVQGVGGGIYNTGTATLTNCTLSGNSASLGGGISTSISSTNTLTNCTVSGNFGQVGGGLDIYGKSTLTNCTISGNYAGRIGGGVNTYTNGFYNGTFTTLTNCTISGNHAGHNGGGLYIKGNGTVINCTISRNYATNAYTLGQLFIVGRGGGAYLLPWVGGSNIAGHASLVATLQNTIVSGNTDWEGDNDLFGPSPPFVNENNLIGGNPLLAPLGNYGGPTQTMPLLPGSPAINAGASGANIRTTDQRGEPRSGGIDIGAFQSQGFTLNPVAGSTPQTAAIGAAFANPLAVTVKANNPLEPVNGGVVQFNHTPAANGAAPLVSDPNSVNGASSALSYSVTIAGGQATVSAGPNNTVGSYTVAASAAGAPQASFALTNAGPAFSSLVVNTTSGAFFVGPGLLSLRYAVFLANSNGAANSITFDPTVFATPQTITLTGQQIELTDTSGQQTIIGPSAGVAISGGGLSRVFQVDAGVSATFSGLTITGGMATGGGGLLNDGTATMINCTFSGDTVQGDKGANSYDPALAAGTGGSGEGGAIFNNSNATLNLTNCTLSGDTARGGTGGTAYSRPYGGNGGGGEGGAIFNNSNATLNLTNCTLGGNTARGGNWGNGTVNNFPGPGGYSAGGAIYIAAGNSTAKLVNTVVAGNTASSSPDVSGTFASLGHNLFGKTDGSTGWVGSDLTGTVAGPLNALLAPLGNYGGPMQTMPLLPGSPAINAGISSSNIPPTDERGKGRVGGATDIGAFESQGFTLTPVAGSTPQTSSSTGQFAPLAVQVTTKNPVEPVNGGQVTFTAPSTGPSAILTTSPATIAGGTASVSAASNATIGTYTVIATAAGAPSQVKFDLNNKDGQTITFTTITPNPATLPVSPITLSASGGASGDPVVFSIDPSSSTGAGSISGNVLTVIHSGSIVIDADQAGNANYYAAATVQQTLVVNKANQTITFAAITPNPVTLPAGPITLSASGGTSGNPVVFSIDPGSTGSGSISGNLLTVTGPGSIVIDANQAGNAGYNAAPTVQQTLVAKANQTITFAAITPNPVPIGVGPITLSATSTSGLTVTLRVISGPGSIGGNTLTVTGLGNIVIEADQAGNANYYAAAAVQQTLVVNIIPLVVSTTSDENDGNYAFGHLSLREAVALANENHGPDSITFDPNVFSTPQTITLGRTSNGTTPGTGQLELSDTTGATTIIGAGVTVSGNNASRVFQVDAGTTASISGLTITGGFSTSSGAGVANFGVISLTGCTLSGNFVTGSGGGGLSSSGTATLINCLVSANSGHLTINSSASGGGGLNLSGTATLTNTMVSGNTLTGSFGAGGGLLISGASAKVTLTDCTVSGNSADNSAGGIGIRIGAKVTLTSSTVSGNSTNGNGGGVLDSGGTFTLTNCTISANSSANIGGGIINTISGSTVTLTNCTISGNSAAFKGGGLYNYNHGTTTLTNTIIAGNTAPTGPDVGTNAGVTSLGNNLIGNNVGSTGLTNGVNGNQVGSTPSFTGNLTSDNLTLTNVSSLTGIQVGQLITDSGGGIPFGTTVSATGSVGGNNTITLSQPATPLATGPRVFVSPSAGSGSLTTGQTYYYQVTAVLGAKSTSPSTEVSITLSGTAKSVLVGWIAVSGPVTKYAIYRGTTSGGETLVGVTDPSTTEFFDSGSASGGTGASPVSVDTFFSSINPSLSPLANNGGPTQTMALLAGSPAIDAGASGPTIPTTDQRGFTRDAMPDIGAYEFGHQTITFGPLDPVTYGVAPLTLGATSSSGLAVTWTLISGPGSISGNTLTVTGADNIVVEADQAGNADYAAAAPVQQTLVVNKANAVVVVTPYTTTYDSNPHTAVIASITGVNGESGAAVGTVTLNSTHTSPGTYAADSWSFTGTANYNNIASTTITDAIAQASATISVTPYTVTYDGSAHTAAGTATGVGGVDLSADLILSGTTHTAIGSYGDTWTFHDPNGNYRDASRTVTDGIREVPGLVVNTIADTANPFDSQTSLREALTYVRSLPGDQTITFDPTVFDTPQTIVLTRGLALTKASGTLTIQGPGANLLSISGNHAAIVFVLNSGSASLAGLTITGGNDTFDSGGGILNFGGDLTLIDCTISGNTAVLGGGGISSIYGTLALTDCIISGNTAGYGGGLVTYGTATLTDCTISGNTATVYLGGGLVNGGTATLTGCTISDNSTAGTGGGGLFNSIGTLNLSNCTMSGNRATGGSGGGLYNRDTATLTNCTLSGNGASGSGGGLFNGSAATLTNTIVAGNTAATSGADVSGAVTSLGQNLIGMTDGSSGWVAADLTGTSATPLNPLLGSLGNYGGLTQTVPLLPGSPAIDAGASGANIPTTDQRDLPRDAMPDIGAYEFGAASSSQSQRIKFGALNPVTYGVAPLTLSAASSSGLSVTFSVVSGPGSISGTTLTVTGAGSIVVEADQAGNAHYAAATSVQQTLVVGKANATVVVTPYTVTYDGKAHLATWTITGVNGETGAAVGTVDVSNTTHSNAGTWTGDSWSFTGTANYNNIASTTITDAIAQASATIAVTSYSVTYDGSAHMATGTATGVGGVDLSADLNLGGTKHTNADSYSDTWTFHDPNGNYRDTSDTVTDVINQATPTVVGSGYTGGTYDGKPHTQTVAVSGVPADGQLYTTSLTGTNAGSYSQAWSFSSNPNYAPANGTLAFTISQASATISVTPYSVTYDGHAHTAIGSVTGVLGESLSGLDLSATLHTGAGAYNSDAWTFTDSTGNYTSAAGTVSDSIAKAALTVTARDASKVYGAANPAFSASYSGFVNGETSSVLTGSPSLTTTATASSPVGPYAITGSGTLSPNYTATYVSGTLTITPAPLTIAAGNPTISYGDPVPTQPLYYGLVNGDTPASLTGAPTLSTTATSASPVGVYPLNVSGAAVDPNYTISYTQGSLTISPHAITYQIGNDSQTYGGAANLNRDLPLSFSTGVNGQSLSIQYTSTGASTMANAGSYPILGTLGNGSGRLSNYAVTLLNGTLTVNPYAFSYTIGSDRQVYGTPANLAHDLPGTILTGSLGQTLTIAYSSPGDTGTADVGTYPITATLGDGTGHAANFAVTLTPGTLTVRPCMIQYTLGNDTQTYGTPANLAQDLPATVATGVNGQNLSLSYASTGDTSNAFVGSYAITGTVSSGTGRLADYSVSLANGKLTVQPYAFTYTIANDSQLAGTAANLATDLGTTIYPGVNGLNLKITYSSSGDTTSAPAGSYPITATLSSGTGQLVNYAPTLVPGTLTVCTSTTQTTAGIAPTSASLGQTITLSATVAAPSGSGIPTGAVDFYDTTTIMDLGSVPLTNGHAMLNLAYLPVGVNLITFKYSGDATYMPSSTSVSETVSSSMLLLDPTASGALSVADNAVIRERGAITVDSSSASAIQASGLSSTQASNLFVVGGVQQSGSAVLLPGPTHLAAAVPDPLAALPVPAAGVNNGPITLGGTSTLTLTPGTYGPITVSGGAKLTLNPGVYVIGGLQVSQGATVTGSHVLLYNTGGIALSGTSVVTLTAPLTGVYAGIALFQARSDTQMLALSGYAELGSNGTIYAPSAPVVLGDNSNLSAPLVVGKLVLSGYADPGPELPARHPDPAAPVAAFAVALLSSETPLPPKGEASATSAARAGNALFAAGLAPLDTAFTQERLSPEDLLALAAVQQTTIGPDSSDGWALLFAEQADASFNPGVASPLASR